MQNIYNETDRLNCDVTSFVELFKYADWNAYLEFIQRAKEFNHGLYTIIENPFYVLEAGYTVALEACFESLIAITARNEDAVKYYNQAEIEGIRIGLHIVCDSFKDIAGDIKSDLIEERNNAVAANDIADATEIETDIMELTAYIDFANAVYART